jgi:hypothetical protein
MKFHSLLILPGFLATALAANDCPSIWTCQHTTTAPTLDADLSEWSQVAGIETPLKGFGGNSYDAGSASYKCLYDDTHIYFAFSIPGFFRFNSTDNKQCASIGTMMKIGADATFMNMGGCPEALSPSVTCDATLLQETCSAYRVDLGAHWELRTTQQGVTYPIGSTDAQAPGNDLVANKDDEYGVSPYCRPDDNDANAGNEWAGSWLHDNPVAGELGNYIFEMSRTLTTPSTVSDAQMAPGQTYQFGVAFWDPEETDSGWTDSGHYLTGCGADWIDLELVSKSESVNGDDPSKTNGDTKAGNGGESSGNRFVGSIAWIVVSIACGVIFSAM